MLRIIKTIYYAQPQFIWELIETDDIKTLKIISEHNYSNVRALYSNLYIHIVDRGDRHEAIVSKIGGNASRQRMLLALAFKPGTITW